MEKLACVPCGATTLNIYMPMLARRACMLATTCMDKLTVSAEMLSQCLTAYTHMCCSRGTHAHVYTLLLT